MTLFYDQQQRVWLECSCTAIDHCIRIVVDRGDLEDEPMFILEGLTSDGGFWIRLKRGIRYILSGDRIVRLECLLDETSVDTLSRALVNYKLHKKLYNTRNQKQV